MQLWIISGLIAVAFCYRPRHLLSSFKTCKRRETNFKECLTSAVQDALQQLDRTHPELGLPSFHPLNLTSVVVFKQGAHRVIPIENKIEYLAFHGLTNTQVVNFNVDFEEKTIQFDSIIQNFTVEYKSRFKGKIHMERVDLVGHGEEVFENSILNISAKFQEYRKNGIKYIRIIDSALFWKPGRLTTILDGQLQPKTEHLRKLMNEHWGDIFEEGEQAYDKILGGIFIGYLNNVLYAVPEEEIFGREH